MGLMGVSPEYRLVANSQDITDLVRRRFVSLAYTDESGLASDLLEVTLADHIPEEPLQIPPKGAELELFLGYDREATRVGMFVVDEIELGGWPAEMVIRARAATYGDSKGGKTNLQSQKTRSWPKGTKLGVMVGRIAREHGMQAAVSSSLTGIVLPHVDQADESDLNLLLRLAKKYDALVKPAGGQLVLAKRGEMKSVGGVDLPEVVVRPENVGHWRMVQSSRESAGMVVAYHHAVKQAKRQEVKVGSGEPVRRLKQYYPTAEMALAAARAELSKRERNALTLQMSMEGGLDLVAEGKLTLEGWRVGIPTTWIVTRAAHRLDASGGWRTDLEAEQPEGGPVAAKPTQVAEDPPPVVMPEPAPDTRQAQIDALVAEANGYDAQTQEYLRQGRAARAIGQEELAMSYFRKAQAENEKAQATLAKANAIKATM